VSLSSIGQCLRSGKALTPGMAAITIDDGYLDAYEVALPILRAHKLPATIFVVTGFLDGKIWLWTDKLRMVLLETKARSRSFDVGEQTLKLDLNGRRSRLEAAARANALLKRLPDEEKEIAITRIATSLGVEIPDLPVEAYRPLSWAQLREMEDAGIDAGSHTVSHPILTNLMSNQLQSELRDSKLRLEDVLAHEVSLFCYPNGDTDDNVQREVAHAGYRCAVTTIHGLSGRDADPLALRRINGEPDLAHFAQSVSGFEELKNNLRPRAGRSGNSSLEY
jgi:peptidoglycan/xylan/chitin deacetylase (PgdA/CDA1 family)